jgi:hypothetical protein
MELFSIFPTTVGKFRLDGGFTPAELDFVMNASKRKNTGNQISIDTYLFEHPEMQRVKAFAQRCLDQYFQLVFAAAPSVKLHITQSWANYTDNGEHHASHSHRNSVLSGVLYVKTDPANDNITFYKQRSTMLDIPKMVGNSWNAEGWKHASVSSEMLIFPSELEHMVENVVANDTRVSLAFNTFLSGTIGSRESITELVLEEPSTNGERL